MRKTAFLILILVFVVSCKNYSESSSVLPSVSFLMGEVFLLKDGGKIPLKIGEAVNTASKLETGTGSVVDIAFGENTIRMLENSVIDIKDFSEKTELFLSKGGIFSRVVKKLGKEDSYTVITPTSVAAVRGTDFLVRADSDTSLAACLNGKLLVSKTDGSQATDVNAGQEIAADQGKLSEPIELSEENRKIMRNILSDLRKGSAAAKIIPHMPPLGSKRIYKVQVGAYFEQAKAEEAAENLRSIGYKSVTEKFKKYYRVVITGVKAGDVPEVAGDIGGAGFAEAWVRE